MDCEERGGIQGVRMRFHRDPPSKPGRTIDVSLGITSFAVTCAGDDEEYQRALAVGYLPSLPPSSHPGPDSRWITVQPLPLQPSESPWAKAQACPKGAAVYQSVSEWPKMRIK